MTVECGFNNVMSRAQRYRYGSSAQKRKGRYRKVYK